MAETLIIKKFGVKPQQLTFKASGKARILIDSLPFPVGKNCLGTDPETASLPIWVFDAVSFSVEC
jgi:hypothetical protein